MLGIYLWDSAVVSIVAKDPDSHNALRDVIEHFMRLWLEKYDGKRRGDLWGRFSQLWHDGSRDNVGVRLSMIGSINEKTEKGQLWDGLKWCLSIINFILEDMGLQIIPPYLPSEFERGVFGQGVMLGEVDEDRVLDLLREGVQRLNRAPNVDGSESIDSETLRWALECSLEGARMMAQAFLVSRRLPEQRDPFLAFRAAGARLGMNDVARNLGSLGFRIDESYGIWRLVMIIIGDAKAFAKAILLDLNRPGYEPDHIKE